MTKRATILQVFEKLRAGEITVDEADNMITEISKRTWWQHLLKALFN